MRISKWSGILLAVSLTMSMASCHTTRKAGNDKGRPSDIGVIHPGTPKGMQQMIVDEAMTWVGTPYKYAGEKKGEGTDCSGMVMRVYEDVTGRKLPRNSAKQAEFCRAIEAEDVDMGDLVFFATGKDKERVSHVGIVVDDLHFVHASSSRGVVVSDIYSPYFKKTFRMFGRVPDISKDLAGNTHDRKNHGER